MMNEENQGNAPKRMSLKKKSSGTMTLQNAGGAKKVQVEVRKKKFNFDPKERKAQLEQEAIAKQKAEEEARKAELESLKESLRPASRESDLIHLIRTII